MFVRRMAPVAPPALLVAVLAHFVGFGSAHALGGMDGDEVVHLLAGSLVLLALSIVLRAALGARGEAGRRPSFTSTFAAYAAGGTFAFGALELLEGNSPLPGPWVPLSVALCAFGVASLSHAVRGVLEACGRRIARIFAAPMKLGERLVVRFSAPAFRWSPITVATGVRCGRAPPSYRKS